MKSAIDQFVDNNKILKKTEGESFILSNLWNDDTFEIKLPKSTNFSLLKDVILPKELVAILHKEKNELEFIYVPLKKEESFLTRSTNFYHKGILFETRFDEPSEVLKIFADGFRETGPATESDYRNLRYFRDFYHQEKLPDSAKRFFKDKTPISFYVKGDFAKINNDIIVLSKHINVYLKYFDRDSPTILLIEDDKVTTDYKRPCLSTDNPFPDQVVMSELDPVILDLFHISSRTSNARLKYLFYYQILEYLAYYFINKDLKTRLNNILRNPDLISKSSLYSRQIIEELKESFKANDDKVRLEKTIITYCSAEEIKNELKCNINSFVKSIEFDGGFTLEPILNNENELDNPSNDLIKKVVDRLDKLRNVMVHIREYRENKAILPTRSNNRKLLPYLYLIRRVAEIVSFKYEI